MAVALQGLVAADSGGGVATSDCSFLAHSIIIILWDKGTSQQPVALQGIASFLIGQLAYLPKILKEEFLLVTKQDSVFLHENTGTCTGDEAA